MRCEQVLARLDGLLAQQVPCAEARELEQHLAVCAECRTAADRRRRLIALLKTSSVPSVPDRLGIRIMASAKEHCRQPIPTPMRAWLSLRWWLSEAPTMRLTSAVALVVGVSFGALLGASTALSQAPSVPQAGAARADPAAAYGLDCMESAPMGSVESAYLSMATPPERGK